ncbi:MAG: LytTR family transcriptional regulator DNA-binding domain-containing protein [Bacteroidota bacterium]
MINAILLHNGPTNPKDIHQKITECCPQLSISSFPILQYDANQFVRNKRPELIFMEIEDGLSSFAKISDQLKEQTFETILIASRREFVFEAIKYGISGYLMKPLCTDSLKNSVDFVVKKIKAQNPLPQSRPFHSSQHVIGIPTIEGYEFLAVKEIIRCESYLKCTRVITKERPDIISSYNIGEFIKALGSYNFYRPHQSHLINLNKVKRYLKEGSIIMNDDSVVPVARRKRIEFLDTIPHL